MFSLEPVRRFVKQYISFLKTLEYIRDSINIKYYQRTLLVPACIIAFKEAELSKQTQPFPASVEACFHGEIVPEKSLYS